MRHFAEMSWLVKIAGLLAVCSMVLVGAVSAAGANSPLVSQPITNRGVTLELTPLVELPDTSRGAARINHFATAGDRLFVVEDHSGTIYEIERNGRTAVATVFFDVGAAIPTATGRDLNIDNSFHGGLRGVAFHPEFETNGLFYTTAMEDRPANPTPASYLSDVANPMPADSVLIEWRADTTTGTVAADSYREVFRVGMPVFDHPIRQLAFNPFSVPGDDDYGLLYVAHGDGSVLSATAGGGVNNDALGKILRVDPTPSGGRGWTVPPANPFVGNGSMIDEAYSIGHRNPHHLSFAADGRGGVHLLVAEVGRDNVEEVNVITAGSNYGWSQREGTFVHLDNGEGLVTGVAGLPVNDALNGFTYPAVQFGHQGVPGAGFGGQAIAGGFVVDNGSELSGEYFFSDFPLTGDIYHSTLDDMLAAVTELDAGNPRRDSPDDLTQAEISTVAVTIDHDADPDTPALVRQHPRDVFDDSANYDGSGRADVRFGQGPDGEMYVSSKRNGTIYLVVNSLPVEREPQRCAGQVVTVDGLVGTPGNDVMVGTPGDDVIRSLGGDDVICGLGGDDMIISGRGNDVVYGGPGDDVLRLGRGSDEAFGQRGRDDIDGGKGHDRLRGHNGADRLVGNRGNDVLVGGNGDDSLLAGRGTDSTRGGGGSDRCVASELEVSCEQ